ncbi:hypothetical protein [Streptomyces sp. SID3343]|uniref:hypothetical protein n=1 Tax=Streptomyces sp. SID3343 TaxID=2690260 RepID=UPI00137027F3|nr:hypothetical protein [Streptomyces sp. SID3343]MYV97313.1 hypothetical protein [Streptomyces sp. SID3343]
MTEPRSARHAVPNPGTRIATDTLGMPPRTLLTQLPRDGAHFVLVKLIARAAERFDEIDHDFRENVAYLAKDLARVVGHGARIVNSSGVVQSSGARIDMLAARMSDADRTLTLILDAYEDLGPVPERAPNPAVLREAADDIAPARTAAARRRAPKDRTTSDPRPGQPATSAHSPEAATNARRR